MRVRLWKLNLEEARKDSALYENNIHEYAKGKLQRPVFTFLREVELNFSEEMLTGFIFVPDCLLQIVVDINYPDRRLVLRNFKDSDFDKIIYLSPLDREPTHPWNEGGSVTGFYLFDRIKMHCNVPHEHYEEYLRLIDRRDALLGKYTEEDYDKYWKAIEPIEKRIKEISTLPPFSKNNYEILFGESSGYFSNSDFICGMKTFYEYTGIDSNFYGTPENFNLKVDGRLTKANVRPPYKAVHFSESSESSESSEE